ncbi:metallophosphoesterase family protein [Granulicella cerasi]|uniref:Phosphoesterase n=1 Tax=Granulicella cerasi TaxID=741063 RepID=A0ABW1ZDH2_9BACT|nr:metallophosphoesterase family protein [Granulicella cerasi]
MRIAVVSDTHGLQREELLPALAGAEYILHAGDVGDNRILDALRKIAPVTAIRGNVDLYGDMALLPATEALELGGHFIYMLHSVHDLDLKPEAAGFSVVLSGHSHKPGVETRNGVMYLNPGSCGPRRFSLPVTFAWLVLEPGQSPHAEIVDLLK